MFLDASNLSADVLARAAVIICVFVLLILSSTISIWVIISNKNLNDATNYYLVSLSIADFLWGSLIMPLSVYSSLVPNWNFMGDNSLVCKSSAYLQIVIMTSTMYIFAWITVDRYSAFMKPSRYESEHTLTRCKCWIAFTWLTALLGALPIVAKMEANYYHEFEFCVLNWSSAKAYSMTLATLVLLPSLCTIIFTTIAIFLALRKPEELEDTQRTAIETDQNFIVTLFVIVSFFLAWLPITIVHFIPESLVNQADSATMKFSFVWMAIGCCSNKLLILIFTNREFRQYLCIPCLGREIDTSADENTRYQRGILARICCFCCPQKPPSTRTSSSATQRQRYNTRNTEPSSNSQLQSFRSDFDPPARNASAVSAASYNYYNGGSNSMMLPKPPPTFTGGARYAGYGATSITQLPPGF